MPDERTSRGRVGFSVALSGGTALVQAGVPGPDGATGPVVDVLEV